MPFQPYNSLAELVERHILYLPKPKQDWRLLARPCNGEINGIPSMRGLAVATNGILVVIETSAGQVFVGHLDFFVKDAAETGTDLFPQPSAMPRRIVQAKEMDEIAL